MSEPIPESIPTSSDRRSHRPTKRRALDAKGQQSSQVEALFANPEREITLPSGAKQRTAALPPEIVANVQGSSAGAGSGEFHVYKASRRREYERLRLMDEEVEREEKDRELQEKREGWKKVEEEKLSKNQAKRAKAKARKEKAEQAKREGSLDSDAAAKNLGVKKKLGAAKIAAGSTGTVVEGNAVANGEAEEGQPAAEAEGGGITFVDDD